MTAGARGRALAGVTALISGIAVFVNGHGVRAWAEITDATTYTTFKNATAASILVVAAVAFTRRQAPSNRQESPVGGKRLGLLVIPLVGGSVPFVLFFEGLARSRSSDAAFIHKTLVLWVAILAVTFLHERVGPLHVAALALLLGGQLAWSGGLSSVGLGQGEMMILAATLLWAVETVVAKRVLADVAPLTVGVIRMAGGTVLLLVYLGVRGEFSGLVGVTADHLVWILITGATLSAYVATWFAALALAPAVDVTAILVGGAVVTALLEFGTGLASFPLIGVILVTAGVLVVVLAGERRPALAR